MSEQLIWCIPNISEGRDKKVIDEVTKALGSEVHIVDISAGESTNRTVFNFVGEVGAMMKAIIRFYKKASDLIDMRNHSGIHPRFGAVDVLPIVPLKNITIEECVNFTHELGKTLGEMGYTIFMYEHSAKIPERNKLPTIREGEYEALEERLKNPKWKPDYGPTEFQPLSGATVVGCRNPLIAVNFNLNTTSTRRANAVAFDVREQGRLLRVPPLTGEVQKDPETGEDLRAPGNCPGTKAKGWYVEEYGCCQVTMNICDTEKTSLVQAVEKVDQAARNRNMKMTGVEIVGLVKLQEIIGAADYYLKGQNRSLGVPLEEKIKVAIQSMGLSNVVPFNKNQIVEFQLPEFKQGGKLNSLSVKNFVYETASESPAPGGGSVAALVGGLGGALGTMVANLSSHKRGWDERCEFFSKYAVDGMGVVETCLKSVDEDTNAFTKVMECFKIPRSDETRQDKINEAYRKAIEVPLNVMRSISQSFPVLEEMANSGMKSSLSDVGTGASCALAGMKGAYLNVQINLNEIREYESQKEYVVKTSQEADSLLQEAMEFEGKMWKIMMEKIVKK